MMSMAAGKNTCDTSEQVRMQHFTLGWWDIFQKKKPVHKDTMFPVLWHCHNIKVKAMEDFWSISGSVLLPVYFRGL